MAVTGTGALAAQARAESRGAVTLRDASAAVLQALRAEDLSGPLYQTNDLSGIRYQGTDLSGTRYAFEDMSGPRYTGNDFSGASLRASQET